MEETNKNEKFILLFKIIAIIIIGGFSCFLIGSFAFISIVNAQESQIQTIQFGNWIGASANSGPTYTIYQKSVSNAPLKNFGRSFLQFNVILYSTSGATDTLVPSLREVNVQSTGNMYTCNLGSVSQSYSIGTTYKANLYSILCDVNLGANGLQMVEIEVTNTQNFPFQILTSDYLTAIDNIDDNISGQIDSINANMGTYIGNLISSQNYGNDELTNIKTMVNTNLTTIIDKLEGINIRLDSINSNLFTYINNVISAINNGNDAISEQTQQQQQNHDELMDDLNDSSTDDPTNDLDDMHENEASNSVISDLLLLPLNMFQRIINSINGTCSTFNLGSLYGSNLTLPCINIPSIIGSTLWGVIDVLFSGIFVLSIRKKFVDIFQSITSLQDRGNELE